MWILNKYIAIGTQLKMERPGKATALTACDTIEGPIVKLKNGNVVLIDTEAKAKMHADSVKEILFVGDLLISYGDFFNRAHPLVPSGYCEEWWVQEAEKAMIDTFGSGDFTQLSKLTGADETTLHNIIRNYTKEIPDAGVAIAISNALKVPLHPRYTYHWKGIQKEDFSEFLKWMETGRVEKDENKITKIVLNKNDFGKRMLNWQESPIFYQQ